MLLIIQLESDNLFIEITFMSNYLPSGAIHVRDIYLWAHVGVLEHERLFGQEFLLDVSLWLEMEHFARHDDISMMADYSLAISELQQFSFNFNCQTIEYFSEQILDHLELLYGSVPMQIFLRKCFAPVPGFDGSVGVERKRNFPLSDV